jgi:uncharacterized protein YndB with AHSA1/START domain
MQDFQQLAPDTLRIELLLDAPPDLVWRWLTEPELRAQWFAGGTAADQIGEFELRFNHDLLSTEPSPYPPEYEGARGFVATEQVLSAEAPRILEHTWNRGDEGAVAFELIPIRTKTRLVLTHRGISGPAAFASFGGGWLSHTAVLQAKLAGSAVRDFWALHRRSQDAVAGLLGATPES